MWSQIPIGENGKSLIGLTKEQSDKVISVFHERDRLKELNIVNDSIIKELKIKIFNLDSIITLQDRTIHDYRSIMHNHEQIDKNNNEIIQSQSLKIKKEQKKTRTWQIISGILVGATGALIICR